MPYVFPIQEYLMASGLSSEWHFTPTKAFLDRIVEHHVMHFPFQNFQLFHSVESRNQIDLSAEGIVDNFLTKKQGGMCYQNSELLFHALSSLGYYVCRLPAFVTANTPYHPGVSSDHNLLLTTVDGHDYLLEVGFGYNSLRAPLPITMDKSTEVALNEYERYQWISAGDHFQLNSWIADKWRPFYRLDAPLASISSEETVQNFIRLRDTPDGSPIRDEILIAGILTQAGRIIFHCEPFGEKFVAYRMDVEKSDIKKVYFADMASYARDIKQTLNLEISATMPGYSNISR